MAEKLTTDPLGDERPVPVEVKMVVWVKREEWLAEHGVDGNEGEDYDFEEVIQDWVREECQELVDNDEWTNVTEVTA